MSGLNKERARLSHLADMAMICAASLLSHVLTKYRPPLKHKQQNRETATGDFKQMLKWLGEIVIKRWAVEIRDAGQSTESQADFRLQTMWTLS
jgi:hypothetical protein